MSEERSFLKSIGSNVKIYVIADGFYYAGYSVVNAFLSLLITSKITEGRLDMVGFVISYYMVIRAISELPLSRLTKKSSLPLKKNIVAGSYIAYGFLILLLGFSVELWQIFLIQTFTGLLDAIAYPIKWSVFTKVIDRKEEESEWALEDITATILPAIFTALAGVVSNQFGLRAAFALFAALLITSGLIFAFIKPQPPVEKTL